MVHLYFNLVGVALFVLVFYGIGMVFPWQFLKSSANEMDIAVIHTAFNVITTLVMLPLNGLLVKLACLSVPETKEPERAVLLDECLLATPAVAIQRTWEIAGTMVMASVRAMEMAIGLTRQFDEQVLKRIEQMEEESDQYEDALSTYLLKLSGKELSVQDNRRLNILLYTIGDVERITDYAVSVANSGREIEEKKIAFSAQAQQELDILGQAVTDILNCTASAFLQMDLEQALKVEPQEQVIDVLVREEKSRHIRRLRDGLCTVEYGFVLDDLLTAFERVAGHCSNMAVEMLQVAEGKLEAHEYLNALKTGELQESAKYTERFQKYKKQYAFPDESEEK